MRKRRTRKEKIIAQLHRKLHSQSTVAQTINTIGKTQTETISVRIPKTTLFTQSPTISLRQSTFLLADLKKSLFVILAIALFELLLYFIFQKRIFGLSYPGL